MGTRNLTMDHDTFAYLYNKVDGQTWYIQDILIHISDISSCHKTIRSQKSHCSFDQSAFPTAGFPHKTKYLSMFKGEAHIMNHRFPAK